MCALAALVSGEQHPMLNVISEHSVALMTMLKTMAADPQGRPEAAETPAAQDTGGETADRTAAEQAEAPRQNGNGRYQSIPIVVEPGTEI